MVGRDPNMARLMPSNSTSMRITRIAEYHSVRRKRIVLKNAGILMSNALSLAPDSPVGADFRAHLQPPLIPHSWGIE